MADNVTLPATGTGTATPVFATQDKGGVHFQEIKLVEVGRQEVTLHNPDFAAVTTEAMLSLTPVTDFVNGTAVTSYTVPTGKILRIMNVFVSGISNGATESAYRAMLRVNPSAAAATSSPIAWTGRGGCIDPASVANNTLIPAQGVFPLGIDIPAAAGVGLSHIATGSTGLQLAVSIVGYLRDA